MTGPGLCRARRRRRRRARRPRRRCGRARRGRRAPPRESGGSDGYSNSKNGERLREAILLRDVLSTGAPPRVARSEGRRAARPRPHAERARGELPRAAGPTSVSDGRSARPPFRSASPLFLRARSFREDFPRTSEPSSIVNELSLDDDCTAFQGELYVPTHLDRDDVAVAARAVGEEVDDLHKQRRRVTPEDGGSTKETSSLSQVRRRRRGGRPAQAERPWCVQGWASGPR